MVSHIDTNDAASNANWTAIVLAGERPCGDPLATHFGVPAKALIEVDGKTLLARVVKALLDSQSVKNVLVLAQQIERIADNEPSDILNDPRVELARSGNGIATSIEAVIGTPQAQWPVLVTTADNALLTAQRVDTFLGQSTETDVAIGLGERSIVELEFPQTKRTWLKFSDGHFSGANLFALSNDRCLAAVKHWQSVEQDRKKGLKLIASFGPLLLLRALTRTIGMKDGLAKAGHKMGCDAKPVILDAEAPIDVDKIEDLDLVEQILTRRRLGPIAPSVGIAKGPVPASGACAAELVQPACNGERESATLR